VLQAMRAVPREAFVPEELAEFAYMDGPLPIGEGQTISQPFIVGLMAELAGPGPEDKVLEVVTGSGYAAAVMSRMAARVYTIERHPELAETALRRLERLGYDNVEVRCGDGTLGWPEAAPFDAIVVAAGGPEVPRALCEQLQVGGRLVIPVSVDGAGQKLLPSYGVLPRAHSRRGTTGRSSSCPWSGSKAGVLAGASCPAIDQSRRAPSLRGRCAASGRRTASRPP
jgi:protein-L-isoaspartate(D-aspartate) O-methyltransferase